VIDLFEATLSRSNFLTAIAGLALFWPFLIECLTSFSNFVSRFWPFFTEGLTYFEKIILATLRCRHFKKSERSWVF